MKAIMVMFDSLNRHFLPNYGCDWTVMPNFRRLEEKTLTFDNFYAASLPCMPARRELHTGRYNFLHSSWCPMQPYDDSVISRMRQAGIYTHIATDHFHYWEDGGSGYLTKYDSHQIIRGQQGDPWMGQVPWPDVPPTLSERKTTQNWRHDWVNRSFLTKEEQMPQACTFECGLDFIRRNHSYDNWFLQIEAFDPHEPFYSLEEYKKLYPDDYHGKNLDWPDYGKNTYGEEATRHVRYEYGALLSMCDRYLGKVLDKMDELDMWKDTMLIVNTDHGFMLGEKEWMGKNVQPMYQEIVHLPFFVYDPRFPKAKGERRRSLSQTIDLAATLADYFQIEPPRWMDGKSLTSVIEQDAPVREYGIFGIFGGHVNVTDGRYVYMRAPKSVENGPLYEYTLMPNHMNTPYRIEELRQAELAEGFSYMNGSKVLRIPAGQNNNAYWYGNALYDLETDEEETEIVADHETELRMLTHMRDLMAASQAPDEQFERLGIPKTGIIGEEHLPQIPYEDHVTGQFTSLTDRDRRLVQIGMSLLNAGEQEIVISELGEIQPPYSQEKLLELLTQFGPHQFRNHARKAILNKM